MTTNGYRHCPPMHFSMPEVHPYLNEADKDRSGERFTLGGCYVWGEIDYFAYMEYLDEPESLGLLWWDLAPITRDRYRAGARALLASFDG